MLSGKMIMCCTVLEGGECKPSFLLLLERERERERERHNIIGILWEFP